MAELIGFFTTPVATDPDARWSAPRTSVISGQVTAAPVAWDEDEEDLDLDDTDDSEFDFGDEDDFFDDADDEDEESDDDEDDA